MKTTLSVLIVLALSCVIVAGRSQTLRAEQKGTVRSIELPVLSFDLADGPGRDKVGGYCGICHAIDYIPMQPKMSKAQWTATVTKMVKAFGAPVPQEDAERIIEYLSAAYGTGK
jgi:cytochrome c5